MKEKVIVYDKCMYCNSIHGFIVRSKNVNSNLKDSDIFKLITKHKEDPYQVKYCETCELQTLQMTVAWEY